MMTSLMTSSRPIEAARGNLPEEHLFEFCAQACPALGMPRGSLTQRQLAHGQLARGDQGCAGDFGKVADSAGVVTY